MHKLFPLLSLPNTSLHASLQKKKTDSTFLVSLLLIPSLRLLISFSARIYEVVMALFLTRGLGERGEGVLLR